MEKSIHLPIFFATPKSQKRCSAASSQSLAAKHAELGDDQKVWKARCVFQGSNVRAKTGTSAFDLFEETSNAPASFAATRAASGVAAMRGFNAFLRDAETAYLQAVIDTPTRTPTFVELPREWWPDRWFTDRARRVSASMIDPTVDC